MNKQRRFIVGMVAIAVILSCLYLLWHEDFAQFWTVVIGGAYFWYDKIEKKEDSEEKEGE